MPQAAPRYLRFGSFQLDRVARELHGGAGTKLALTGKAFDTLCVLIDRRDRVVSKDELLAAVWPGRVVEENNLTQAVSALRRALGADGRVIVTLPGRGYRFASEVLESEGPFADPDPAAASTPVAPTSPFPVRRWLLPASGLMLLLVVVAAWAWHREPPAAASAPVQATATSALAVLPFRSLSPGPRDPLLDLGLAETLIARISRATPMRVHSLSSTLRFLGSTLDPLVAGRRLGADYVVEGTTQRQGSRLRVNARLLAVADGRALWSGTFDAAPDRVFTLQDGLATAISSALAIQLRGAERRSPCDGADAEAYRAYLTGRYQLDRPSAERMRLALASFRRAIDRDPTCARAYAGMAYAQRALVMTGDEDPRELFPLAKAAVARALAIDPELSEAHASSGFIAFWYDWDWAGSEASLKRAIDFNPSSAEAHIAYAHLLYNLRRMPEAAVQARLAMQLDPLSPLVHTLGSSFVSADGDKAEGARALEKALAIDPDFWTALMVRGARRVRQDPAGALADLTRARQLCGDCSQATTALGLVHVQLGQAQAAEQVLQTMQARARNHYVPATSLAALHLALGDRERALALLERAHAERDSRLSFLVTDLRWKQLHAEPRFRALAVRMGLALPASVDVLDAEVSPLKATDE